MRKEVTAEQPRSGGKSEVFDAIVIGAGQAAIPLAFDLASAGRRVAVAERRHLGGSCANFGCTPTKAVQASARVAHLARRAAEFGLRIPSVQVDFAAVLAGARELVRESREGLEQDFAHVDNPVLLRGHARLDRQMGSVFRIRVGDKDVFHARQVVLDTGTRSRIPPIPGLSDLDCLTAENWLESRKLPSHLILLGGGYIGLEMSQFYRRMGSRVTVLDRESRLLPDEDKEVAQTVQSLLEEEGIVFRLGAEIDKVETSSREEVLVTFRQNGKTEQMAGSHLFVAMGRQPNTEHLGLETVGLKPTEEGFICVDERLATVVKGIWAVGDIRGGPKFTHTSWDDYRVLRSQLLDDGKRTTSGRTVPYAIFTDPPLARVGITETAARRERKSIMVGRYEMCHNGHAREYREKKGFISLVVDAETGYLLGATVLADQAAELIHLYLGLMNLNAPYTAICDAIYVHPTLAEAVQGATENVRSRKGD
jgi:pyruvate/2-oxoglutarate dehydrogenase complex dihydrolipoamide dehydrogenase (E3) component